MHIISIFSTLVTFAFAAAVYNRYQQRRGNHLLFWGIGLIFYGLGTMTEAVLGYVFDPLVLKLWYLSGAMLTAAWLGQGTVFLLVRKQGVARGAALLLMLASVISLGLILAAPLTPAAASYNVQVPVSTQYRDILTRSGLVVLLTIVLNIYGTIGLVGGAIYSSFLFWRKKVLANRLVGNILIAAGALMPAMAGSLIKAGLVDWLYVSELLGVILMFAGFWYATASQPVRSRTEVTSAIS